MRNAIFVVLAAFAVAGCEGPEGPAGPQGPAGADGADGADGLDGTDGADGADGSDGTNGTDGADGADGADGNDGVNGSDGSDGADGADGADGLNAGDFTFRTDDPSAYTRVDRMGMPAVATAVVTSKDDYNAADPTDDVLGDFVTEISDNVAGLHAALDDDLTGLFLTPCVPAACVAQAAPLVVPDTLKIDFASAAGFPNGRGLEDPVIDVTLAVVLLNLNIHGPGLFASLPLNPDENDRAFMAGFPYLAPPHQ